MLILPDFIANASGVICAAMEYRGATEQQAFATIAEKIRANVAAVCEESRQKRVQPRQAAIDLAERRIRQAMSYRRSPNF